MPYNQQWPGHGKEDMAQSLAKLVAITPQLPIGKIVNFIKRSIKRMILWVTSKRKRKVVLPSRAPFEQKSMSIENSSGYKVMLPDWKTFQTLHEDRVKEYMNHRPSSAHRLILWSKPKVGKLVKAMMQRFKVKQQKAQRTAKQTYENPC